MGDAGMTLRRRPCPSRTTGAPTAEPTQYVGELSEHLLFLWALYDDSRPGPCGVSASASARRDVQDVHEPVDELLLVGQSSGRSSIQVNLRYEGSRSARADAERENRGRVEAAARDGDRMGASHSPPHDSISKSAPKLLRYSSNERQRISCAGSNAQWRSANLFRSGQERMARRDGGNVTEAGAVPDRSSGRGRDRRARLRPAHA